MLLRSRPFVCYSHWESVWPSPPVAPRRAASSEVVRAGLFARAHKHHPTLRETLRRAVAASPALRLVLKDDSSCPLRRFYPSDAFPEPGLRILPFRSSHRAFMDAFNDLDMVVDSQPYSGTTITCAALYMGVPVLSLLAPGARHVSNVSAALLLHLQRTIDADPTLAAAVPASLAETFVATGEEDFAQRLVDLSRRGPAWWAAWRKARPALAQAFRRTMDPALFMRDLEEALEGIASSSGSGNGSGRAAKASQK